MTEPLLLPGITSGFVELNQCQFYYQIAGLGHPLALVHAGICDSRMWDDQWSTFGQKYRVMRFDMRGFGQSSAPPLPFAPHEDLRALLQFLGIRRTYLLGASMGGQVALEFALAYPEMVNALILVAPYPLDPPAAERLAELRVPTLVIVGALDFPEAQESAGRLTDAVRGAQHVVIPGAAHLPSMERPAEFNARVLAFLEQLDHSA